MTPVMVIRQNCLPQLQSLYFGFWAIQVRFRGSCLSAQESLPVFFEAPFGVSVSKPQLVLCKAGASAPLLSFQPLSNQSPQLKSPQVQGWKSTPCEKWRLEGGERCLFFGALWGALFSPTSGSVWQANASQGQAAWTETPRDRPARDCHSFSSGSLTFQITWVIHDIKKGHFPFFIISGEMKQLNLIGRGRRECGSKVPASDGANLSSTQANLTCQEQSGISPKHHRECPPQKKQWKQSNRKSFFKIRTLGVRAIA